MTTSKELVAALQLRYGSATFGDRIRILDEFVALTGYHRKHAIRLLRQEPGAQRCIERFHDVLLVIALNHTRRVLYIEITSGLRDARHQVVRAYFTDDLLQAAVQGRALNALPEKDIQIKGTPIRESTKAPPDCRQLSPLQWMLANRRMRPAMQEGESVCGRPRRSQPATTAVI